ncbi:MAG: LacI family DNA-binding transcriptional regulator [Reichenbachiella sp.]
MKRITIKEIAKEAGVSVGTVDRVLHNRGDVAEETKKLVLRIAKEGNYTTNVFARTLKLNRTFKISVIIPQDNEYWLTQKDGIEIAAKEYEHLGIEVSFFKFERNDTASFIKQSEKALESKPDGVVIAPLLENDATRICQQMAESEIPYVFVDSNLPDMKPLAFVGQDTRQSGFLAAKLLNYGFSKGHRAWILKYSDYDIWNKTVKERINGFRQYYQDRNWSNELITELDLVEESNLTGYIGQLESDQSLHIFVPNSRAYQVVNWLKEHKIENTTRLVGYDQVSANAEALKLGNIDFIINQNPLQQGYLSIQALYKHLILNTQVEPFQYMPVEIVAMENMEYANVPVR